MDPQHCFNLIGKQNGNVKPFTAHHNFEITGHVKLSSHYTEFIPSPNPRLYGSSLIVIIKDYDELRCRYFQMMLQGLRLSQGTATLRTTVSFSLVRSSDMHS